MSKASNQPDAPLFCMACQPQCGFPPVCVCVCGRLVRSGWWLRRMWCRGVGYGGTGVVAKGSMGVRAGRQGFHEAMLKNPNGQRTAVWMGPAINQARRGLGSNRVPSDLRSGIPQPSYPGDCIYFDATKIVVLASPVSHTSTYMTTCAPTCRAICIHADFCAKQQAAVFM